MNRVGAIGLVLVLLASWFVGCTNSVERATIDAVTKAGGRVELSESGSGDVRRVVFDRESHVTQAGLEGLQRFPKLQGLLMGGSPVTDSDLGAIGKLTSLEWLDLSGTKISDASLASLSGLGRIQTLNLSG